jgi:uncharacterized protein (DUF302 family)
VKRGGLCAAVILLFVTASSATCLAEDLLMVRSHQPFPEAMLTLQASLRDHGYTVSHVQRVDVGLTGMGYQTDKYRVVFFGKIDEVRPLTGSYPALVAYLPPQISIYGEGEQTIVLTPNPKLYASIIRGSDDAVMFERWESDLRAILRDVREAEY